MSVRIELPKVLEYHDKDFSELEQVVEKLLEERKVHHDSEIDNIVLKFDFSSYHVLGKNVLSLAKVDYEISDFAWPRISLGLYSLRDFLDYDLSWAERFLRLDFNYRLFKLLNPLAKYEDFVEFVFTPQKYLYKFQDYLTKLNALSSFVEYLQSNNLDIQSIKKELLNNAPMLKNTLQEYIDFLFENLPKNNFFRSIIRHELDHIDSMHYFYTHFKSLFSDSSKSLSKLNVMIFLEIKAIYWEYVAKFVEDQHGEFALTSLPYDEIRPVIEGKDMSNFVLTRLFESYVENNFLRLLIQKKLDLASYLDENTKNYLLSFLLGEQKKFSLNKVDFAALERFISQVSLAESRSWIIRQGKKYIDLVNSIYQNFSPKEFYPKQDVFDSFSDYLRYLVLKDPTIKIMNFY